MKTMSQWLQARRRLEHLTLRETAARTGLSYATIANIIGQAKYPSPETIQKLAKAFGGAGTLELEDYLLTLAGYRSERPEEQTGFLKTISLLTGDHQHIVEVLVREMAKIDGI